MIVVERLIRVLTALALSFSFVAVGFLVDLTPATTSLLANSFSNDKDSPFDRSQLVAVADATRDYAFGSHDLNALYKTIASVDEAYGSTIREAGGKLPSDFPRVQNLPEDPSIAAYAHAFSGASEIYGYSPEIISHLDDCYSLVLGVYPVMAVMALIAIGGLIYSGIRGKKRALGLVLFVSGVAVIVLVLILGLWAVVDFNGFFANFHNLFFAQGNWTFPADSLLICALPEGFWMGAGILWVLVSLVVSALSLVLGLRIWRRSR